MTGRLHLAPVPEDGPRPDPAIKVLLADDHLMARRNLRLLLDRETGMEVIAEAEDLGTVVRHVAAHRPHVLVVDLQLPSGSSIATIHRLRELAPGTGIVMLTMEESPAFAQQALDAGAIGYVVKDHADDELPVAVRRVARGEEYVSPRLAAKLRLDSRAQLVRYALGHHLIGG